MKSTASEPEIFVLRSPQVVQEFSGMALRDHIQLALNYLEDPRLVLLGARVDGQPAGLLICAIESHHTADIKSVYVRAEFRRLGIASSLVQRCEQICRQAGVESLLLGVVVPSESQPIRAVLAKCNWLDQPKRIRTLRSYCSPETRLAESPVLRRQLSHPDLELFPWYDVSSDELHELYEESQRDDCWFDKTLSPLVDNRNLHRETSLGLRFRGKVIGWSVTHRIDKGPIIFSVMFARKIPEYPLAGLRLLQGTAESLIRQGNLETTPLLCAVVSGNKFFEFLERKIFDFLPTVVTETDVMRVELNKRRPVLTLPGR